MLYLLIITPLIGSLLIACTPGWRTTFIRQIALITTYICAIISAAIWASLDHAAIYFQHAAVFKISGVQFAFGVDGMSTLMILLTAVLMPVCVLIGWRVTERARDYCAAILALEALLFAVFCALDLLLFYEV